MTILRYLLVIGLLFSLLGCKWRDDFRERVQPQYAELPAKPTLNPDSDQYVGDKEAHRIQGEYNPSEHPVPEIDDRSDIPPLPEHPSGIE